MPKSVSFQRSKKFGEDYTPPQTPGGAGGGHVYHKEAVSTTQDISQSGYKTGSVGKSLEELGIGQGGEPFPKSKKELKTLLGKYKYKLGPDLLLDAPWDKSSKTQVDKLWEIIKEKQLGSASVGGIGDYTPVGKVGKTVKKANLGEGVTVKTSKGVIQPGKDIPFEAQQRQLLQPIETDLNILYEQADPKKNPLAKDKSVQESIRSQIAELEVDKDILKKEMGESIEQATFKKQVTTAYEAAGIPIPDEVLELATQEVEIKGPEPTKVTKAKRFAKTGVYGFGIDEDKSLGRSREGYKKTTTVDCKTYQPGDPKVLSGKKDIYSLERELARHEGKTFIKDAEGRVIGERVYDAKKGVTMGVADPVKYYDEGKGDIVTGRTKKGKIKTAKVQGPSHIGIEPEGYSPLNRTVSLTGENIQQAKKRNVALAKAAGWDTPSWSPTKYEKISKDYSALVSSGQIDAGKMNWDLVISDIDAGKGMGGIADYTSSAIAVRTGSTIAAVPKTTPDAPKGPKSPKPLDSIEQNVRSSLIKKGIEPEPSRIKEIADIIKKRGKGKFLKYGALAATASVIQGIFELERDR